MTNYKTLKAACYTANISMSVIANISPLLFLTFRSVFGISYSLLGLLVLINFCSQLCIDLIFSFFSHKFNIPLTVKIIPFICITGMLIYAIYPVLFPSTAYLGLVLGTIVFSISGGLGEVLISPVIAAIPADDPDREMSKLHSIYAWGVVGVVIYSTIFLLLFGTQNWYLLVLSFILVPLCSLILFQKASIPALETPEKISGALSMLKNKGLWICVLAIFCGGASECTMAQWCSGYIERSIGIDKVWGDIFGVALFSVMLGLGRTMYAKIGKNIHRVLLLGSIGAALCYLVASVAMIPVVGLLACALTGLCTSMLWPGSLIAATERNPGSGVFLFAMMAAGGDLGASIGPQMVGLVTDNAMKHPIIIAFADKLSVAPDQLSMRLGMLIGMIFPIMAIFIFVKLIQDKKKAHQ